MSQKRVAIYYRDSKSGKEPAKEWLDSMRDRVGQTRIYVRIERAESGNFGDYKSVGDGVMELRINVGPGYRVYCALEGTDIILLLVAGDKSSQSKNISQAQDFWKTHKKENKRG